MSVYVTKTVYDDIISYSLHKLPNEACGLLLGEASPSQTHVHTFIPLHNPAIDPTRHFIIHPIDMLPYLTNNNRSVVGIFHSHPKAAPIPSNEDLDTLWHTIPTYWILSLQDIEKPNLQIFRLKKTTTTEYHKLSFVIGQ